MAKKKMDIKLLNSFAEQLQEVRMKIKTKEERFKQETEGDYSFEKELKEQMILGMKSLSIKTVGVLDGDTYSLTRTHDFVAKNPIAEEKWARENKCTSIDRKVLKQRYREALKNGQLPDFVEAVERETISIRTAKKEAE